MKIVIDKNIPFAEKAFKELGEVVLVNTGEFNPDVVRNADVLIVRSETKVNESLLDGSSVKFVGTATIGFDHLDVEYLKSRGIAYASAPGCNSNSVKEYIIAALLIIARDKNFSLKNKILGVVGVGNVGSKVVKAAESIGMTVLQNDPPRARVEKNPIFLPLDELMNADILTLHVPLTKYGEDATYHFFDEKRLAKMKKGSILINTARGAVVDTYALKNAIKEKHLSATVIDVWENEPNIDPELLSLVTIGTPHIAGYSLEGRTNAVQMMKEAVCKFFNISSKWNVREEIGEPELRNIFVSGSILNIEQFLYDIVKKCYDIEMDHKNLLELLKLKIEDQGKYFRNLRTGYRLRREFTNVTVHISKEYASLKEILINIGFKCIIK